MENMDYSEDAKSPAPALMHVPLLITYSNVGAERGTFGICRKVGVFIPIHLMLVPRRWISHMGMGIGANIGM